MSYVFETLGVSHQDVLTHQFLDHRVGASVQLSQEAQAETLQPSSRETVSSQYKAGGITVLLRRNGPMRIMVIFL